MPIDLATIKYLLPELLLVVFAILVFVGGTWNRSQLGWSLLSIAAFGLSALMLAQQRPITADPNLGYGAVIADPLSHGLRAVALLLGALFCVFATQSRQQKLYPELLGSLILVFVGLMLVCSAGDLSLLFVGLELISIPTYVLLFIGRNHRASDEAAAKYFFLSILSSAMLLYGFATLYGLAGEINLSMIQASLSGPEPTPFPFLYPVAVGMIVVGFCFKIAAAPFHFYAPDVYQATTNLNAALLAVVPKIAGVVGLVRILVVALPHDSDFVWKLIIVLSMLTMTLGNVAALWQSNVRRLLAYSSIAHAGYLFVGLAAAMGAAPGVSLGRHAVAAMLFYVVAYSAATVAAFAAIAYLSDDDESFSTLDQLAGVGRRYPIMGGIIGIAMFSLAGIPPLAGFWGKLALFRSSMDAALSGQDAPQSWFVALSIAGVVNAAIAAGYYLRVVGALYFQAEDGEAEPVLGNAGAGLAAVVAAAMVVAVGLFTGPAMTSAQSAATSLWPDAPSSTPPPMRTVTARETRTHDSNVNGSVNRDRVAGVRTQ